MCTFTRGNECTPNLILIYKLGAQQYTISFYTSNINQEMCTHFSAPYPHSPSTGTLSCSTSAFNHKWPMQSALRTFPLMHANEPLINTVNHCYNWEEDEDFFFFLTQKNQCVCGWDGGYKTQKNKWIIYFKLLLSLTVTAIVPLTKMIRGLPQPVISSENGSLIREHYLFNMFCYGELGLHDD